ncbi:hypothetical protein [Microbacterium sp. NPDC057944]|uniref:hypothetical protein n=1 Tax=Microbacterium sp. NPDC057944 TaxID=3346286 RepID=UPI0036DBDDD1
MSEPLQPPVPPYGQPTPQPQSAPHPPQPSAQPQSAPHPPQPQPAPHPPQPQSAPPPPQPYGGPQGHPPETAPYQRVGHPVGAPHPAPFPTSGPAAASLADTTARRLDPPQFSTPPLQSSASGRIAFVIALIGLGMSVAPVLAFPAVIRLIGYSTPLAADAIYAFVSFLAVAASVLALTLGLFSLRRPGPRGLTGLAIGIAIAVLVGAAVSRMSTLFYMSL